MADSNPDAFPALRNAAARAQWPLIMALVGALAGWGVHLGFQEYIAATSPTSCAAGCVTNGTLPVSSDPAMTTIENEITAVNAKATASGYYYSVVLLDPFTFSTSSTISESRMVDELQGAYLALAANQTLAGKHKRVAIQLLLANEGTSAEEGEPEAVRTIQNLAGPDHIVAVAGMGLSTAKTETAATALAAVSMPMFGAVTTGDQFNGDDYEGYFQVVPDVDAQVNTLVNYLNLNSKNPSAGPVAMISSDQQTDIYSVDLQTDFTATLRASPQLGEYSYDPTTAEQQFAHDASVICARQRNAQTGSATPTSLAVLYAGRETTLPILVKQFQQAQACAGFTITIVTGSDSNALPASATEESDTKAAHVKVVYSDIESVADLPQGFPAHTPPPTPGHSKPCQNQSPTPGRSPSTTRSQRLPPCGRPRPPPSLPSPQRTYCPRH